MSSVDDRFRLQFLELSRQRQEQRDHLPPPGGGGTSGGVTDDWKASVDERLKHLREDVQQVRNWIVTGIAIPLLAIVGLYVYNGSKFDALDKRLAAVEVQQAQLDGKLDRILERLPIPRE